MTSGLNSRCAQVIASHSTSRPSASVLITSTVWPDMVVTTSPGRWALPSGMFSTSPQTPTTLALALRSGERLHRAGDRAGAAHVPLHRFHALRRA